MRYFSLIIACFSILTMQAQKELVIINTNDTHSTVMPLSSNLDDTLKAGRAGYLRRLAVLEEQRKSHPDLMLFDCGDFSQGSPYYTMFKGEVEVKLVALLVSGPSVSARVGGHQGVLLREEKDTAIAEQRIDVLCDSRKILHVMQCK